jgi:hypothetical protein
MAASSRRRLSGAAEARERGPRAQPQCLGASAMTFDTVIGKPALPPSPLLGFQVPFEAESATRLLCQGGQKIHENQ